MRKIYCFTILLVIVCVSANSQIFSLLKDINPGVANGSPGFLLNLNGTLFFQATSATNGAELWKSDGTEAGTVMIKDINPGAGSSNPGDLFVLGSFVFFIANDGVHGNDLWKTNGTAAGTVMVKDIPGQPLSFMPKRVAKLNNATLIFCATDATNGAELWKSDGTAAGTTLIKDIYPGTSGSDPGNLTEFNGAVYFSAKDENNRYFLWKTNGTAVGTVKVKDLYPLPLITDIVNAGGTLFIIAGNTPAADLYKSDGTTAGTVLVKSGLFPSWMTQVNGTLYFQGYNGGLYGNELWKSDGTAAGTLMVKDIMPGNSSSYPTDLINVGGTLFFIANEGNGPRLWKTDGTEAGTIMLTNYPAGSISDAYGVAFFSANDGVHGFEPWKSNSTEPGTIMIQDLTPSGGSDPQKFTVSGSKLFVSVTTNIAGRELWVADISSNGSLPLLLSDFKVQLVGHDGALTWKTVSEEKTAVFEIERSYDGNFFDKVGSTPAAGNSTIIRYYSYTDRNITAPGKPVVYYRLKMKDVDGKFVYSRIIALNISSNESVVMLYPNPVQDKTTLMISVIRKEKVTYKIIDPNGKVMQQKSINVSEGSNSITIETNTLAAGTYMLVLNGEYTRSKVKFIKQ